MDSAAQPSDFLHLCVSVDSQSVESSEKTIAEALKKVEEMSADLERIEILDPLKHPAFPVNHDK